MVTKSWKFLRNCQRNIPEKFIETNQKNKSHNSDPLKNSLIGGNTWRISRISEESVTRTCSWEIPRKFLKGRNSPHLLPFKNSLMLLWADILLYFIHALPWFSYKYLQSCRNLFDFYCHALTMLFRNYLHLYFSTIKHLLLAPVFKM